MLKTEFDLPLSESEWKEFVRTKGFGEMIAFGRGREFPVIVPTHFIFDGEHTVELHVHAANPLLRALREHNAAVLSVVGAVSFIPSSWNCEAGSDPCWSAPTSYYAAVQLRGTAEILERDEEIASLLNRQSSWFQPGEKIKEVTPGDSPFGQALAAIRGLRMAIHQVEAKFKFGGNREPDHRARIAEKLLRRGLPGDAEAVSHILRRSRMARDCGVR
jgi:transcriptional regulator